jgi:hypothetical protein
MVLIQEGKASVPYLISCISIYIEENIIYLAYSESNKYICMYAKSSQMHAIYLA